MFCLPSVCFGWFVVEGKVARAVRVAVRVAVGVGSGGSGEWYW